MAGRGRGWEMHTHEKSIPTLQVISFEQAFGILGIILRKNGHEK